MRLDSKNNPAGTLCIIYHDSEATVIDDDWRAPAVARDFGWDIRSVQKDGKNCEHAATDGTSTCEACGITSHEFVSAATQWIDDNDGKEIENMSNAIQVIHPYWDSGSLVFDDLRHGLVREPFVGGSDVAIDVLAKAVLGGDPQRFTLLFSHLAFPGHQLVAHWLREEAGGNWYRWESLGMDGWLCPALLHYFETAPKSIYVQIKPPRRSANEGDGQVG